MRLIDADVLKRFFMVDDPNKGTPFAMNFAIRSIIDGMPTVLPTSSWISTKDRLPELGEEVLICLRGQTVINAYLKDYGGGHYSFFGTACPLEDVLYWMSMLPLPKEEKE